MIIMLDAANAAEKRVRASIEAAARDTLVMVRGDMVTEEMLICLDDAIKRGLSIKVSNDKMAKCLRKSGYTATVHP